MAESLTRAQVAHVARLARLALTDEELDRHAVELTGILRHVDGLAALDLTGIAPTNHPLPLVNVLRPDTIAAGVDRDEVLACAPLAEDHRFRVPKILDHA